jgi:hypothetical protein
MKETKAFLNKVRKIDMLINNKLDEIQQLRSLAESTSISLGERVQSSGSQHKMADRVDRIVDMEREVDAEIDRLLLAKKEVIDVIEQLSFDQYDLMYQVYVKGKTLQDYSIDSDRSYNWVKSVHGRALVNVRDILKKNKLQ